MTLDEFVTTYDGQQVEFDGAFLYQCVDLVEQYMQDVLGLQVQTGLGNAHAYYDNFNNIPFLYNNFNRITYDGNNTPIKRRYYGMVDSSWRRSWTYIYSI